MTFEPIIPEVVSAPYMPYLYALLSIGIIIAGILNYRIRKFLNKQDN